MRLLAVLFGLLAFANPGPQREVTPPPDPRFFAVSYVEVIPASRKAALAAFKESVVVSRKQDGHVSFELFEQVGRPAHFAVVETWRDQKAFDAGRSAVQQRLLDVLQPIRVSGFDQRPYKTLIVDLARAARLGGAVSVISHVDVSPDPRVAVLLQRLAEASRLDHGNVRFDVFQHTMRGNHFTIVETWRNQKSLDDHAAAPHTRQYRDELQPFTGSPLDERVYKQLE